jgi:hypothetical protein
MCTNSCFLNVAITTSLYINVVSMMLLISLELGNSVMVQVNRNNEFVGEWKISCSNPITLCSRGRFVLSSLSPHHFPLFTNNRYL